MFSFTEIKQKRIYSNLQEEFIEILEKNVKAETFKYTEQKLREKLKKEFY